MITYPPELLPTADEDGADVFVCPDHSEVGECPNCVKVYSTGDNHMTTEEGADGGFAMELWFEGELIVRDDGKGNVYVKKDHGVVVLTERADSYWTGDKHPYEPQMSDLSSDRKPT